MFIKMANELKKLILFILCVTFLAIFFSFISSAMDIVNNILSIFSFLGILFVIIAIVIFVFLKKVTKVENPREVFGDLILVLIWLGLTLLCIFLPPLNSSFIRVIVTLPILLFLPGYAMIAVLFPYRVGLDTLERIILSFGLSIVIVSLLGLVLNYTQWGIRLEPLVVSLVLFIISLIILAGVRRMTLPFSERFIIPWKEIATNTLQTLMPRSQSERVLSIILLFSILVATAASIYVITVPKEGQHFTEFYLLGENGKAADYPDLIIAGQRYPMFIGVGNHEYRTLNYTIETWIMRMKFDNVTNTSTILAMDPGERMVFPLAHNETMIIPYNLSGERNFYNRVEFLLFNETVPNVDVSGSDRINASYRDLHFWINIREGIN
jgi:uncharacterized membrane protein